jgi:hypothetical protein
VGSITKVPMKIQGQYYWGAYTYEINKQKLYDKYVEIESLQEMQSLPLKFSFSRTGSKRFSMKKLFTPNKYWSVTYDDFTSTVTFTAKRELGVVNVHNYGTQKVGTTKLSSGFFQQHKAKGSKRTKGRTLTLRLQYMKMNFQQQKKLIEISTSRFWGEW